MSALLALTAGVTAGGLGYDVAGGADRAVAAPTRDAIAATAAAEVGYAASAAQCQKYGPLCDDWCAMFATWVWERAGVAGAPRSTYVATAIGTWGVDRGLFKRRPAGAVGNPLPGDLAVYGEPGSGTGGHVSVVQSVNGDGTITTIDGNYGNRVARRVVNPLTTRSGGRDVLISGYVSPPGMTGPVGGRYEVGIWRPAEGRFHLRDHLGKVFYVDWGGAGDLPVTGDWNGDGRFEVGIWRSSEGRFHLRDHFGKLFYVDWGGAGDVPVTADWNGDGRFEVGIWRPSEGRFHLRDHLGKVFYVDWGGRGDVPVTGDWNGDGRFEVGIWRPSEGRFHLRDHFGKVFYVDWGGRGDVPVTADWNGS